MKQEKKKWQPFQLFKKGFTLAELMVVMAIIGMLVLFAAPWFMGKTRDANLTNVKNDIKIAEGMVAEMLASDDAEFDLWEDVSVSELEILASNEELFGRGGLVHEIEADNYKKTPDNFVENGINSRLAGDFFVTSEGVIYYHAEKIGDDAGYSRQLSWSTFGVKDSGVVFEGLSANAFDESRDTYHMGIGDVTWSGNLANRDIEITGKGSTGAYGTYPSDLILEFLNNEGIAIPPVGMASTKIKVAPGATVTTIRLTVPAEATRIHFSGSSRTSSMLIHEIAVSYEIDRPTDIQLTSDVDEHTASFKWNEIQNVVVNRDKTKVQNPISVTSYTDSPLYSGKEYAYEIEFIDDSGKRRIAHYDTKTANDVELFRGLSPSAFDGKQDTYHTGVGDVTWGGDLASREIEITGKGSTGAYGTYPSDLILEFLNDEGIAIPPVGMASTKIKVAPGATVTTIRLTVPAEATRIHFSGSSRPENMLIHEITVID